MKMDKVAGSKNDENYTPVYAITPLFDYIPTYKTIWCPFDTEDSHYVKEFRKRGNKVIATHIENGQDFFIYEPEEEYDLIVSNPPYSLKAEVFERLFKLDKPFAMLVGVVGLFESQKRFELFRDNDFEVMYFNRRVSFFQDFADEKPKLNPPFSSVYITKDLLPTRIVFEEIEKK